VGFRWRLHTIWPEPAIIELLPFIRLCVRASFFIGRLHANRRGTNIDLMTVNDVGDKPHDLS
jgi:hypothetical protein